MRPFDSFVKNNEVRIVTPNKNEAKSLIEDAKARYDYYQEQEVNKINAKYIFENVYESIRELLDAVLLQEGFKSYSHQAPIIYAKDKNILNYKDAVILDNLRELRNKSKYYGKKIPLDLATEKIVQGKEIFKKLKQKLNF